VKTFLNDGNLSVGDFEKLLTGLIFFLASLAVIYKYITKDFTDYNFVGFTLGIGALFITRKVASYWKPSQYTQQYQQQSYQQPQMQLYSQPLSPIQNEYVEQEVNPEQNQTISPKSSY
jgi:hypothetical protein